MKIIHCADIHLDSPFTAFDPVEAQKRRTALRSAFSSLLLYAKSNKTELFLISGDLFDDESVTKDTSVMLCREMASLPDCRFVISPGNHDPYTHTSLYKLTDWPENVYIFDSEDIKSFDFPEINTTVYGYAFTSDTYSKNPLENFSVLDKSRINIMCAHCDFGVKTSNYAPVTKEDILKSGLEYFAMGHIHKSTKILSTGSTYYAYSGCLQGRSFDETGHKGAIVGDISKESVNLKHTRFSGKHFENFECDVTGHYDFEESLEKIKKDISVFDTDTILRITLSGVTGTMYFPSIERLKSECPFISYIELCDNTLGLLDAQKLKEDKTIVGEFYRAIESKLTGDDENEKKVASLALKYALMALNSVEVKL